MTVEADAADLFGLAGTFPRPAWVVLDAARDHRFTGELLFDTATPVRVCFDRGHIYLAERTTDPPLGARLVDAGALNAAQLEHGAMRIGDHEHLGWLFDRAPSVDRQFVVVVTEMMNEACVAELAGQQVRGVESTPYLHHPSGIHRWRRTADEVDLRPGDPLPAPAPTEAPIETFPPESIFDRASNDTDTLIRWDEPSWLDERTPPERTTPPAVEPAASGTWLTTDWADRLEDAGLPTPEDDPFAAPAPLPPIARDPFERFEVIWPSGDVDETFGSFDAVSGDDERDRVGPTARVARSVAAEAPERPASQPSSQPPSQHSSHHPSQHEETWTPDPSPSTWRPAGDEQAFTDDTALSMRRAVASIDSGSLEARRRLVTAGPATAVVSSSVWSVRDDASARSVFDDEFVATDTAELPDIDDVDEPDDDLDEAPRTSALRRLIGGLRRR